MTSAISLLLFGSTLAADIPASFRAAFDARFRPGRTYAVVQKQWIPAAAISDRDPDAVDVVSGGWKRSRGFGDPGTGGGEITAWLGLGEVVELVAVHYKDDRIDLIFRSAKTYDVVKKDKTRVEQIQTRFKFFFPFPLSSAGDLPRALDYIEPYLRDFPTLAAAQAFSDELAAQAPSAPRSEPSPPSPRIIGLGQTPEQVKAMLGQPEKIVDLGANLVYYYSDMVITFMNGRLTDVQQR